MIPPLNASRYCRQASDLMMSRKHVLNDFLRMMLYYHKTGWFSIPGDPTDRMSNFMIFSADEHL